MFENSKRFGIHVIFLVNVLVGNLLWTVLLICLIVSNNSSGMVCGTEFNAYHTLKDVAFILPNGNGYDTSKPGEKENFLQNLYS